LFWYRTKIIYGINTIAAAANKKIRIIPKNESANKRKVER